MKTNGCDCFYLISGSPMYTSCLLSQCIEGLIVSRLNSSRSVKKNKTVRGHRPVNIRRAAIGRKGGWKARCIF